MVGLKQRVQSNGQGSSPQRPNALAKAKRVARAAQAAKGSWARPWRNRGWPPPAHQPSAADGTLVFDPCRGSPPYISRTCSRACLCWLLQTCRDDDTRMPSGGAAGVVQRERCGWPRRQPRTVALRTLPISDCRALEPDGHGCPSVSPPTVFGSNEDPHFSAIRLFFSPLFSLGDARRLSSTISPSTAFPAWTDPVCLRGFFQLGDPAFDASLTAPPVVS